MKTFLRLLTGLVLVDGDHIQQDWTWAQDRKESKEHFDLMRKK